MAAEADVDVVVTGTLLRAGDRVWVASQLVEAPAGTLLWSQSAQVTLTDIFELEGDLVHRIVEALALPVQGAARDLLRAQRASVEGDRDAIVEAMNVLLAASMRDPEGIYLGVRSLALLGLHEEALRHFERVVDGGYYCVPNFLQDPWLTGLRAHKGFAAVMGRAEALHAEARRAFEKASGPALLGVGSP